ncbi:hypothetical protein [Streptomyces xanthophaeus]|uniref:hypothetical protein n=1 Tax=Streptomyces xanthophaeus TaxID=67385 RepID=UPI0026480CA4|nr:hypothetical protein [Streptomyces xanthophaeus]WKD35989.1 hypothetical protein KO717_31270 [Streptomyces xanthophaeus]
MRQLTCYITATLDRAAQRFDTLVVKRHPAVIVGSGIPLFDRPGTSPDRARTTTRTIDPSLTITHFSRGLS